MIRLSFFMFVVAAVVSVGAQNSGIFFEGHVSRGIMGGDNLCHFEGTQIGVVAGDSICYLENGKEAKRANNYSALSHYPVDFQYAVRYSFLAGYEMSFSRVLSLRGALGYQNALMDAYAATIPGAAQGDMTEIPFVDAQIDRHWMTIPLDVKVTLPIGRSGLYLAAGPKASILFSSKYTNKISYATQDLGALMPRFNLGLGFRVGAEFAIANVGFLFVESGYHHGLLNTSPISSASTQEGEIALLGLGFRMNIPQ